MQVRRGLVPASVRHRPLLPKVRAHCCRWHPAGSLSFARLQPCGGRSCVPRWPDSRERPVIRFLLPPVDTPPCPLPICFSLLLLLLLPPPFPPLTVDSCEAAKHQVTAASACTTTCDNGECCAATGTGLSPDKTTCGVCPVGTYGSGNGICSR